MFAIGTGLFGLATLVGTRETVTPLDLADLVVGAALCASLWVRRTRPVEIAAAATIASTFSLAASGATLVMIFTVAVHRRFTVAVAVALGNVAAGAVLIALNRDPSLDGSASMVVHALIVAAVTLWGMFIRARRQLVHSLRERARQAEAEAQLRVEQARDRERARIAREMHDVLAHRLSLVSVHANALAHQPDRPSEDIARASDVIRQSAHQALDDLREVIGVLRADTAERAPTPGGDETADLRCGTDLADLADLVEESARAGMDVRLHDRREGADTVPHSLARCLHRVVQEGLTNARKHAPGAPVTVELDGAPGGRLRVRVCNAPPVTAAPDPQTGDATGRHIPGSGTGLVGLRERVHVAGGQLAAAPSDDGGFELSAVLPWPAG